MLRLKPKAQSTLEYALVIAVIVAALMTINYYMKKGFMGRLKESTDTVGKQFDPTGNYFSAWHTISNGTTSTVETRNVNSGATTSNIVSGENVSRAEHEMWQLDNQSAPGRDFNHVNGTR